MRLSGSWLFTAFGRVPRQLVIQFTDVCNARCPQCGMRVTERFQRSTLAVDEVKRILDRAAALGIRIVSFTGGEPLLKYRELLELMHYAGSLGIDCLRTGTNGFQFHQAIGDDFRPRMTKIAEEMAETPLRNFWISLDSAVPEVHESMRGFPGVVRAVEQGLPIFHEHGIYPSANLGINRNVGGEATREIRMDPQNPDSRAAFREAYENAFRQFYRRVIDMGFTLVNACYPMSMDAPPNTDDSEAVYAATSTDDVIRFTVEEKVELFAALVNVIPEFRGQIRIFSPLCSLYALKKEYEGHQDFSYPCRGGIDFFFIDSRDGNTYPCGYRGADNLGPFPELSLSKLDRKAFCRRCDWECFRDPSELMGPIRDLARNPMRIFGKAIKDKEFLRLWLSDVRYYWACDFFNGRRPPRTNRMQRFAKTESFRAVSRPPDRPAAF